MERERGREREVRREGTLVLFSLRREWRRRERAVC